MAACVMFSFWRPILLGNMVQDVERIKGEICSKSVGRIEYIKCLVLLILVHHLIVFTLEAWSLSNWLLILAQTLISSVLTMLIVIGYDMLKR